MSNIKSGIVVTASEIEAAFEFFDVDKKGLVNIQDLRRRLSVFYKNMPSKDYRFWSCWSQHFCDLTFCQTIMDRPDFS